MNDHSGSCQSCDMASIEAQGMKNAHEKYQCKITVLQKVFNEDLYRQYPCGGPHACGRLEEGQVFITSNRWDPPDGFCAWAWGDLRPMIHAIHGGDEVVRISCCTDALRPVTFKLERMDARDE